MIKIRAVYSVWVIQIRIIHVVLFRFVDVDVDVKKMMFFFLKSFDPS